MSRGSTFVILRRNTPKETVTEEQVMKNYPNWCDWSGTPLSFNDLPSIAYLDKYSYVDTNTMEVLTVLAEASFTSSFTALIEHYNLSYYNEQGRKDRVVITSDTARDMIRAVKYLQYEDYSKRTESLLDNPWIEVFSDGYTPYMEWKDGVDYEDDEDTQWYLKRLRQVLEAFLFIRDETDDQTLLLYYTWG